MPKPRVPCVDSRGLTYAMHRYHGGDRCVRCGQRVHESTVFGRRKRRARHEHRLAPASG